MTIADDAHAIANLKARYCAAADRSAHDPAGARAAFDTIFLPEVAGHYGHESLAGIDAVAGFLCSAIAGNSEWLLHMLHSPLIQIDGDGANGDWTVMVHLKRRTGGEVDIVIGRYADGFRRTADGWRIAQVNFARLN